MKIFFSIFFSLIVLVITSQNALFMVDYQLNYDFYEAHCINKAKPELECNGKCQIREESKKTQNPISELKLAFEFNVLPSKPIEFNIEKSDFSQEKLQIVSINNILLLEGFFNIIPHPPQI